VVAVDINPRALQAAAANAERNGVADLVDVRHSQPRLADSADPSEGDEARMRDRVQHCLQLARSADEAGALRRQVRRAEIERP
jgi:methylase of polypeptide subunit release factors